MGIPQEIVDVYTDILGHQYQPNGQRVAVGTTLGTVVVLEKNEDDNEINFTLHTKTPSKDPILGVDWGPKGILLGTKLGFYLYPTESTRGPIQDNPIFYECMHDVNDIKSLSIGNDNNSNRIAQACSDGSTVIIDLETKKPIITLRDHANACEVMSVSEEHLATGGQDGNVFVYDTQFRNNKPIWNFNVGQKTVPGLALSKTSTWLAAGIKGAPNVYNLRTHGALPPIPTDSVSKIYTINFDEDGTMWYGGSGSMIYKSECLMNVTSCIRTAYGNKEIHHIFSIATGRRLQLSAAGSSNSLLITENGQYWDTLVSL